MDKQMIEYLGIFILIPVSLAGTICLAILCGNLRKNQ